VEFLRKFPNIRKYSVEGASLNYIKKQSIHISRLNLYTSSTIPHSELTNSPLLTYEYWLTDFVTWEVISGVLLPLKQDTTFHSRSRTDRGLNLRKRKRKELTLWAASRNYVSLRAVRLMSGNLFMICRQWAAVISSTGRCVPSDRLVSRGLRRGALYFMATCIFVWHVCEIRICKKSVGENFVMKEFPVANQFKIWRTELDQWFPKWAVPPSWGGAKGQEGSCGGSLRTSCLLISDGSDFRSDTGKMVSLHQTHPSHCKI
jgi:hypothetical protein